MGFRNFVQSKSVVWLG